MARETEIDRLVVRLIGDGRSFQRMLRTADMSVKRTMRIVMSAGRRIEAVGARLKSFGRGLALRVTLPIVALGAAAIKVGSDFESGFAGVEKTVNASKSELASLRKEFKVLAAEMPVSIDELLRIGEIAGQLGISSDKIISFTKTIAMLGVTTNLSVEDAAISLARFANITGLSQDKISNLGSAVVALGNNFATSEAEITEMATRLASAGSTVGMTDAQILAFAGSLSAIGQRAEAGGSAFSRLFITMAKDVATGGKSLEKFAKVAEVTAEDFRASFRRDAAGAVIEFLQGLKRLNPELRILALAGLKLDSIRMGPALLASAKAVDKFVSAQELSKRAFRENNALAKEAATRFKTFASQVILLKNQFKLLLGDAFEVMRPTLIKIINQFKSWVTVFRDLTPENKKFLVIVGLTAIAIGPLLFVLGTLIGFLASVATAFGIATIAGIAFITTVLSPIVIVSIGAAAALVGVLLAVEGLFSPIEKLGNLVGGWFVEQWDKLKEKFDEVWKGITDAVGSGDLKAAFRILWTELKLIVAEATEFMRLQIFGVFIVAQRIKGGPALKGIIDIAQSVGEAGIKSVASSLRRELDILLEPKAVVAQKPNPPELREDFGDFLKKGLGRRTTPIARPRIDRSQGNLVAATRGSAEAASRISNRGSRPDKVIGLLERLVGLEEEQVDFFAGGVALAVKNARLGN